MYFELFMLVVAFGSIASIAIWTVATGCPPTPTSLKVRSSMIGILPSHLPGVSNGKIYELGSGWGGVSRALANQFHSVPVIGVEISPLPFVVSWVRNILVPKSNLKLIYGNFLHMDLSDAALVVCYLSRGALLRLTSKLERELAPEALIVSNTFGIPGWQILDKKTAQDLYRSPIYLYERRDAVAFTSQF